MTMVLYFNIYMDYFNHGYYKTLPLGGTPSSVFNNTYNQENTENKTYYLWSFITEFVAVFTMTTY